MRSLTCSLLWKTVRGSSAGAWMGKSTELGMSNRASKSRSILIGIGGWHQNGWNFFELHVEDIDETGRCWRTNVWYCHKMDKILWQTLVAFLSRTLIIQVNACNVVMWEALQNNADWDCFKTPILQEILRTQHLLLVERCAFEEVIHLFQSVGCVRKQISVSHSSTESEIISLDAGLRLDGIPALDLWDLIVTVLHGHTHQNDQVRWDPLWT